MKRNEDEKRGWILVAIFLLIGLSCVILAGNLAIRFAPSWSLNADMRSRLDPDSDSLSPRSGFVLQPLDPAILTPPVWINVFLTPGQTIPTRLPKATPTPTELIPPTQDSLTLPPTAAPTETLVYWPATPTSNPVFTRTSPPQADTPTPTSTFYPPVSTATPTASATYTPTPTSTPSNVPAPQADLQITMSDGVTVYSAGSPVTYTVVVSNNGPSTVIGAQIADALPPQISNWSWICASQNNGASGCDPLGSSAVNFSDTVDLPLGASITYTVTANTPGNATGNLSNTASITSATVADPVTGNNTVTDTDDLANSLPYAQIGTSPDGITYFLPSGSSLTLAFPLVVNGHPSWDFIFYELPHGSGIAMDLIIIQVGDGSSWYTIFNWGDNVADTNSNLNINVLGGNEIDNRDFTTVPDSDVLYPFNSGTVVNPATGIVFDLDGVVPNGTYPYLRMIAPTGDLDGGTEVDAVTVMP